MAVSNIFLTSGIRENLFSLQRTERSMEITQNRLATGLKVNSALDDPINFFAAQGHRQRAGDLAVLKDAMNEGIQTIKAADAGIKGIMALIEQAKSIANSALTTPDAAANGTLSTQYDDILDQIEFLVDDSNYKGTNLLDSGSLVVQFDEANDSKLTVTGFSALFADLGLSQGLDFTAANVAATVTAAQTDLEAALGTLRTQSQALSSNLSIVTTRLDFTTNMVNTLNTGADNLTLADMNEESANMLMLQTRQALATASLGMASDAAQAVLRLF